MGWNAGSDSNTLVVQDTLNAPQITVGADGNKLLLSQSHRISDTENFTLSGRTIERGAGVSEALGNINLTAASFLDFGAGAGGTLRFGTYTPTSWCRSDSVGLPADPVRRALPARGGVC